MVTAPAQADGRQIANLTTYGWTSEIHQDAGNIGLADGSVQQMSDSALLDAADAAQDSYGTTTTSWYISLPNVVGN
jgi:prepilin-type processing-associated H-X9-DG protein